MWCDGAWSEQRRQARWREAEERGTVVVRLLYSFPPLVDLFVDRTLGCLRFVVPALDSIDY